MALSKRRRLFQGPFLKTVKNITKCHGHLYQENNYKMLLSAIVGLSLLTGFVLVSHSQMSDFQKAFKKKGTKKLRQNVNTVQQVLAAAYLKVFCSVTSLRFVQFHL